MSVTFLVCQFLLLFAACLQLTSNNAFHINYVYSKNNLEITSYSPRQQIIGDYNLMVTLQLCRDSTKIRDIEGPMYTTNEYE